MNTEHEHTESGNSPPTAALEAQIQAEIAARRDVFTTARKMSLGHAQEIGRLLVQLKAAAGHGNWLQALKRCGLSERSAQRYMKLAEQIRHAADLAEPTTIRGAEAALTKPKRAESEEGALTTASPALIERWRTAWAALAVTEAEVEEVERAVVAWQESIRIIYAVRERVLSAYPKRAPEIGPAAAMDGNLEGVGKAFRCLFETKGVGNGYLAAPSPGG